MFCSTFQAARRSSTKRSTRRRSATRWDLEPPAGLIVHTSGATSSGWRIFDVWETNDDFERFNNEIIMPAVEGMGLPEIPPQVYELTNVIRG